MVTFTKSPALGQENFGHAINLYIIFYAQLKRYVDKTYILYKSHHCGVKIVLETLFTPLAQHTGVGTYLYLSKIE